MHHDKETFADIINEISNKYILNKAIIEKDYYVTLFLKELQN